MEDKNSNDYINEVLTLTLPLKIYGSMVSKFLAYNFINHVNNFYWLELVNFCNNNLHTYKTHEHTQQILNESNDDNESVFTRSSKLRHRNSETNIIENEKNTFHKPRLENPERVIISHFNINAIRNKLNYLTEFSKNEIDILISKTKLDSSIPQTQFSMSG